MHKIFKVALHLFFWLIYSLLAAGLSFKLFEGFSFLIEYYHVVLLNFVWAFLAFYSVYLFIYKLFEQKKFVAYFFTVIGLSVFLTIIFSLIYQLFFSELFQIINREYYTSLPGTFIIANCGSLLKGFISWFDAEQKKTELEKQSLKHELESLKSQISPHFLFNTLNNIDSLIHVDSKKASEALIKLSGILRYMLYGANHTKVLLQNEVEHLSNIIELQKLRWLDEQSVVFNTKGIKGDIYVAPLIFSPFIENAFKYAIKDIHERAIEIRLEYQNKVISFYCKNYYQAVQQSQDTYSGRIGLKNVKRRLNLLYDSRYDLNINSENGIFEVDLKLFT